MTVSITVQCQCPNSVTFTSSKKDVVHLPAAQVSVTVAVVFGVSTVVFDTTGTLLYARPWAPPVGVLLIGSSYPPGKRGAIWELNQEPAVSLLPLWWDQFLSQTACSSHKHEQTWRCDSVLINSTNSQVIRTVCTTLFQLLSHLQILHVL